MVALTNSALHFAFKELLKAVVVSQSIQILRFNTILMRLEYTLKSIEPIFYENQRLIKVLLDHPQKETLIFISYLKKWKEIVLKRSKITFRNNYQKLLQLNNNLVRFFQTELQLKTACGTRIPIQIIEELRLDITSLNDSVPEFIENMSQLKVLSIKGVCDHPSKVHNLSSIARLTNLTTLRLEHVSISSLQFIFVLKNLKQLSFVMCEMVDSQHFDDILPNLTHLEIDMCYDLKELPSGLCNITNLQKLSITNCHELGVLPKALGELSNLESLSLHCCTKLQELPESIGSLRNLSFIDISDCLSISELPEETGGLCGLRVLKMNGCAGLQELPVSASELSQLEEVICDEETSYLWMDLETDLQNLKINVVEDDRLETFMKIVHQVV